MADTGYKPVPHDATFRQSLLTKPGVKKAFDALEEEYTALHAMLDARQAAGLTQADVAQLLKASSIAGGRSLSQELVGSSNSIESWRALLVLVRDNPLCVCFDAGVGREPRHKFGASPRCYGLGCLRGLILALFGQLSQLVLAAQRRDEVCGPER